MPSGFERKLALSFSLKLTLTITVFFMIGAVGLYAIAYELIGMEVEKLRGFVPWETAREWCAEPALSAEEIAFREAQLRALPNTDLRDAVESRILGQLALPAVCMLFIAFSGGLYVSYRATYRMRRVVSTVREIIRTGEISARVSAEGERGDVENIISLFNRMLDRGESLIRRMHESLDNVAHDLRTPMTRLRATAETALLHSDDQEKCIDAVADCMEESDRVLTMLTTLMDVAEADAGVMRLYPIDFSVREAAEGTVELYELVAEENDVQLKVEVPDDLTVCADPARIRQVLANLVDNAIKYGREGQTVTISAERQGELVTIRVADEGRGIPSEEQGRIWDRLYRGDLSRGERGLGLGLSFVKAIVGAHGGEVGVQSEPERGSIFSVTLPVTFSLPVI